MLEADRIPARSIGDVGSTAVPGLAAKPAIDEYILLKGEVLGRVLRRTGISEEERAAIAETNRRVAGRGANG